MMRTVLAAVVAGLSFASAANAQTPWQFRWQAGQVLKYRAEQSMLAVEEIPGDKTTNAPRLNRSETSQKVNLTKVWKVQAVDAAGVATIEQSLAALRIEQKTFSGEVLVFDSSAPDKSDKSLREQLGKFVGSTLAVLRIDSQGKVVEVKTCNFGKPAQYERELPFVLALAGGVPQAGSSWQRPFSVTLDPPEGTGEKYEAVQTYTLKGIQGTAATVSFTTAFKSLPKAAADQPPLLQYQPTGEVVFDTAAGRVQSIRLEVAHELKDHQGEGSSYSFKRTYSEQFIGN